MEFLDGETLATRLRKGAVPLNELLKVGIAVADALEMAHRAGIVHRDLKPGNIMLTKGGAKLMDFGLAKPAPLGAARTGSAPLVSAARTMSGASPLSPLTTAGSIVGTIQYMSPEQIEGKEADSRSDVFAFGAVMYEMVTGKRAFEGKSQLSVASAILEKEPDAIGTLKPLTPPALEHTIRRCLAKEQEKRWQSAGDVSGELLWIAESGSRAGVAAPPMPTRKMPVWLPWAAVAVALLIAAGTYLRFPKTEPSGPAWRVDLNLPPGIVLDEINTALALSPDGERLAFAASGPGSGQRLWLRSLNGQEPQSLAGTEGATYPFWSPDGRYVGFFASHKLKKFELASGRVQTLCDARAGRGGTWNHDGLIVLAPDYQSSLWSVPSTGGSPTMLTRPAGQGISHRLPHFLPDGKHVLYLSLSQPGVDAVGIYILDVESKQTEFLARTQSEARYVAPGYLVFLREANLMAQPFDARTRRTTGEAVQIAEGLSHSASRLTGAYTLSDTGLLLYYHETEVAKRQLTFFDAEGKQTKVVGEPEGFEPDIALSPDGRRAAMVVGEQGNPQDLWVYDLATGSRKRQTFGKNTGGNPAWSPDGSRIIFVDSDFNLFIQPVNGSSPAKKIHSGVPLMQPNAWSPDEKFLAVNALMPEGTQQWILPLQGDGKPYPFVSNQAWDEEGTFSPDGKSFAYITDETGQFEVYMVPFPGPGARVQVSTGGGQFPQWISGGRELAYVNQEQKLVATEIVGSGSEKSVGNSLLLFGGHALPALPGYDGVDESGSPTYLTNDGKEVLLAVPTDVDRVTPLTLVLNWTAELKK
jgi:Tol biopolymer transport system component